MQHFHLVIFTLRLIFSEYKAHNIYYLFHPLGSPLAKLGLAVIISPASVADTAICDDIAI